MNLHPILTVTCAGAPWWCGWALDWGRLIRGVEVVLTLEGACLLPLTFRGNFGYLERRTQHGSEEKQTEHAEEGVGGIHEFLDGNATFVDLLVTQQIYLLRKIASRRKRDENETLKKNGVLTILLLQCLEQ